MTVTPSQYTYYPIQDTLLKQISVKVLMVGNKWVNVQKLDLRLIL